MGQIQAGLQTHKKSILCISSELQAKRMSEAEVKQRINFIKWPNKIPSNEITFYWDQ